MDFPTIPDLDVPALYIHLFGPAVRCGMNHDLIQFFILHIIFALQPREEMELIIELY